MATRVALPLVEPSNPLKLALRRAIGQLACALNPAAARVLAAGNGPDPLSDLDRLMLSALRQRAARNGSLEAFTASQQRSFWSSAAAADFHATQEQYFEEWFLGHNLVLLTELERALTGGEFRTLCEIGCGTGNALDYLRRRLTGVEQFIGIDLSPEQIRRNEARFAAPDLSWVADDALQWVVANARPGWVFLSNNGVLEYFTQAAVQQLFTHIAARLGPALISLCEPVGLDHDLERDVDSSTYGTEHSFSHNYPHLLREAGFRLIYSSELRRGQHRLLRVIART